jgi:hypothetical protein
VKGYSTEMSLEVTSLGVQVHGGMGFIEETGAAQYFRDARIAPIYEGTNGIQAADFVSRKLSLDQGAVFDALMDDIAEDAHDVTPLVTLSRKCKEIGEYMRLASVDDRLAGSLPFLTMCAVAVAGWQMLLQARAAAGEGVDRAIVHGKPVTARYFLDHIVPESGGLEASARAGADLLYALDAEELAR